MIFDNFALPLPWYNGVILQDRFRQNVALNDIVTQLAPKDGLLPFQFRKPVEGTLPITWSLKCASNGTIQDYINGYVDTVVVDLTAFIVTALEWTSFAIDGEGIFDYIIFKNEKNSLGLLAALSDGLPSGVYYLEMNWNPALAPEIDPALIWVSETFRVPDKRFSWGVPPADDCEFVCFKWSHNSDIKPVHYNSDDTNLFYNLLYLDTFITASEPLYEVAGENDGMNEFHANFKKLMVKYRVSAFVPDYIKVALFALQLHENQVFFSERGLRYGDIKHYEISAQVQAPDGAYSIVEILFEQISLLTNSTCANNMLEPEGVGLSFTPPTLAVDHCEASGDVTISMTGGSIPDGLYGELHGSATFGGTYTMVYPYISKADMLAGWSGNIGGGLGLGYFRIDYRTFSYYDGAFSGPVGATPSC